MESVLIFILYHIDFSIYLVRIIRSALLLIDVSPIDKIYLISQW